MPLEEFQEILRVGESVSLTSRRLSLPVDNVHRIGRGRRSSAYLLIFDDFGVQDAAPSLADAIVHRHLMHLDRCCDGKWPSYETVSRLARICDFEIPAADLCALWRSARLRRLDDELPQLVGLLRDNLRHPWKWVNRARWAKRKAKAAGMVLVR